MPPHILHSIGSYSEEISLPLRLSIFILKNQYPENEFSKDFFKSQFWLGKGEELPVSNLEINKYNMQCAQCFMLADYKLSNTKYLKP
jgi:hypothetical protein